MTTLTDDHNDEQRLTLADCQNLAAEIPKRRRFALLYTEHDGSICRAEGLQEDTAPRVLYLIRGREQDKRRIASWMSMCKTGGYMVSGSRNSVVVIRTK